MKHYNIILILILLFLFLFGCTSPKTILIQQDINGSSDINSAQLDLNYLRLDAGNQSSWTPTDTLVDELNAQFLQGNDICTNGTCIPLISASNTWSANQLFSAATKLIFRDANIYSPSAGILEIGVPAGLLFTVASGNELLLVANTFLFENGAIDTFIDWGTSNTLKFGGNSQTWLTLTNAAYTFAAPDPGDDILMTFTGNSNNGSWAWRNVNNYFDFLDDIGLFNQKKIFFGNTSTHIYSPSTDTIRITGDNIDGETYDGNFAFVGKVYQNDQNSNTVKNTTTETSFDKNFTLPQAAMQAGKVIKIRASGFYSSDAVSAGNLNIRIKAVNTLGTATVLTSGDAACGSSVNKLPWKADVDLIIGVDTFQPSGWFEVCRSATKSYSTSAPVDIGNPFSATTFIVTADYTVADVDNNVTLNFLTVEVAD